MTIELRELRQEDIKTVKSWLLDKNNAKWLDPFFQSDNLRDEQIALFLMRRDKIHYIVMYDEIPVGMMGLVNIDQINKSAHIWSLLGNKDYRRKGIITIAHVMTLQKAFYELNLHSVNAYIVDGNISIGVVHNLHFNFIGRQRECHMMDGVFKDRIFFDILRNEFDERKYSTQIAR